MRDLSYEFMELLGGVGREILGIAKNGDCASCQSDQQRTSKALLYSIFT
jgi:hypothetical protein